MNEEELALQRAFSDIYRGYSEIFWRGKKFFIKHLDQFDKTQIDEDYLSLFNRIKGKGIPTTEEKLKTLDEQKLWTKDDEKFLVNQRGYLSTLRKTKEKLAYDYQIRDINKQISEAENKILIETIKKNNLLGQTCESFVDNKMQSSYIKVCLFNDAELKEKSFTDDELNELEQEEIDELTGLYVFKSNNFNENNLKKIAISHTFRSFYSISDNISDFFKKSIFELSINQINLIYWANQYKFIFNTYNIPEDIMKNPDLIEQHVNKIKNTKNNLSKGGSGNKVLVGASAEEGKQIGAKSYAKQIDEWGQIDDITEAYKKMKN